MHEAQLYTNNDLAQETLKDFARLFSAIVSKTQIESQPAGQTLTYVVDIPSRRRIAASARTPQEALVQIMLDFQEMISEPASLSEWPEAWHKLASTVKIEETPERTKTRRLTIGVTSTNSLVESLNNAKGGNREAFAETARRLATSGFEEFDARIFDESPKKVLAQYEEELAKWQGPTVPQWMLRLEPDVFVRLKLSAKEYGKSASEFALMCIAHELAKLKS